MGEYKGGEKEMCEKNWEIDTSDIEFDFPDEKKRYRRERTIELAIRTIDEIIGANTEGESFETSIFYAEIIEKLLNRVKGDIELWNRLEMERWKKEGGKLF